MTATRSTPPALPRLDAELEQLVAGPPLPRGDRRLSSLPNEQIDQLVAAYRAACALREQPGRLRGRARREAGRVERYRELLLASVAGVVTNVAAEFAGRAAEGSSWSFDDLQAEANCLVLEQLLKAYNPVKGTWPGFVQARLRLLLATPSLDRQPARWLGKNQRVFARQVAEVLAAEGIVDPSGRQLADAAAQVYEAAYREERAKGLSPAQTHRALSQKSFVRARDEIEVVWRAWTGRMLSLDRPQRGAVDDDGGRELAQQVADPDVAVETHALAAVAGDDITGRVAGLLFGRRDAALVAGLADDLDHGTALTKALAAGGHDGPARLRRQAASPHRQWAWLADLTPQLDGDWSAAGGLR